MNIPADRQDHSLYGSCMQKLHIRKSGLGKTIRLSGFSKNRLTYPVCGCILRYMKKKLLITGFLAATLSLASLTSAGAADRKDVTRFSDAINKYLVTDYGIAVKDQDSSNDATCLHGIYLENAAFANFDNVLSSLHLPKKLALKHRLC